MIFNILKVINAIEKLELISQPFVINVAQNFKEFVSFLQSAEPKIHILHDKRKNITSNVALQQWEME